MPARNKKNFRSTKSGAGMTQAGVKAYRRLNPGSKLKTAVTGKVKKGSKAAKGYSAGYTGSAIKTNYGGVQLSNPSYEKYYKGMI